MSAIAETYNHRQNSPTHTLQSNEVARNSSDFASRAAPQPERLPTKSNISDHILNLVSGLFISDAQAEPFDYSSRKVTKDNFENIKKAYDRDGEKIVRNAGGKVWENFKQYYEPGDSPPKEEWKNTCAVRLSHAMNGGDNPIPESKELPQNIRVSSSERGDNFIFGARDFNLYMKQTNGSSVRVKNDLSNIAGKKGVIYFDNFHIDLWDGSRLHGNNPSSEAGSVAKDYINNEGRAAFFWEAK